jgi:hypothetical protein
VPRVEHQIPTNPPTCTASQRKTSKKQRAALEEFCPTIDLPYLEVEDRIVEWHHFYNCDRPHDSLGGRPPIDRVCDLLRRAPTGEEIAANYNPSRAFIMPQNN